MAHKGPGKRLSMVLIAIKTETIRLSQMLKLADAVQDGAEAKFRIANEEVRVNGAVEIRRGRKLRNGDRVEFAGETYKIVVGRFNHKI
jgi:ribosome-associated protein